VQLQNLPTVVSPAGPTPANTAQAAREFEALWIEQMLHSARPEAASTLGGEPDSTRDLVLDMADQQIARMLAAQGGLGLASLVQKGVLAAAPPPKR
jgi:Rod binding domain-containing protein